jgi:GNAT superfamily N-acetyltransferase
LGLYQRFRGSKQGIAGRLLRVLLDWCNLHHVGELYLGTTAKFLAAHRFYEKNGFSEIKQSELPVSFPIMSVDSKFYKYVILNGNAQPH